MAVCLTSHMSIDLGLTPTVKYLTVLTSTPLGLNEGGQPSGSPRPRPYRESTACLHPAPFLSASTLTQLVFWKAFPHNYTFPRSRPAGSAPRPLTERHVQGSGLTAASVRVRPGPASSTVRIVHSTQAVSVFVTTLPSHPILSR